ncbi:MAG TPA: formate dehydrogenase subunit gamma [Burkholderiales bacterium]|nr:formate dehydrogenase subunit gamma [Burkholderiales bacterium]
MQTLSRLGRLALAVCALMFAGAALAQSPAQQQQQRRLEQPGNNAPVWREVRKEGQEHYTSVKGRETGVLVQSAGDTWRRIRNGPITFYSGWLIVIVCLIIAAIYFAMGPMKLHEKPTGRLIERFTVAERWAHWVMGISFCVLGVTGLIILFGKHIVLPIIGYTLFSWLSALSKNLHNFVAPLFIASLLVFIVIYVKDNLPEKGDGAWLANGWKIFGGTHLPSGRFNAGEKVWFWAGVVVLCLILSVTGLILLFPNFDQVRATMQQANIIHAISGILVIGLGLGHIYMGTIGVEGAYRNMRDGVTDETWAKEHHEYWYNDVKSGKIAAKSGAAPQIQH